MTNFTDVLLRLVPVLLSLAPNLLNLVPVLLNLGPCFTEYGTLVTTRAVYVLGTLNVPSFLIDRVFDEVS